MEKVKVKQEEIAEATEKGEKMSDEQSLAKILDCAKSMNVDEVNLKRLGFIISCKRDVEGGEVKE